MMCVVCAADVCSMSFCLAYVVSVASDGCDVEATEVNERKTERGTSQIRGNERKQM